MARRIARINIGCCFLETGFKLKRICAFLPCEEAVACVVTRLMADTIKGQEIFLVSETSDPALGPTQPPIACVKTAEV
jgi:hypothetical protein